MATLPYTFYSWYCTLKGAQRRPVDFDVYKMVHGVKGEEFKGYVDLKIGGVVKRFNSANIGEFVDILMRSMGNNLSADEASPISIVPIPSSNMAVGAVGDFRTVQLARKVARGVKGVVEVSEAIRWDAPREKAHLKGGARHYSQYEPHMVLTATPAHDVVLFDDVITSGSQMIAAARFLRARGINVRRGVTFARAVQAQYDEQALLKREGSLDLDPGQFDLDF